MSNNKGYVDEFCAGIDLQNDFINTFCEIRTGATLQLATLCQSLFRCSIALSKPFSVLNLYLASVYQFESLLVYVLYQEYV